MTKTIQNGGFTNPTGGLLTGNLLLVLSQDAKVAAAPNQVAPIATRIAISAGNIAPTLIYFNDELLPGNTYYTMTAYDAAGNKTYGPEQVSLTGAGPLDLGTLVPLLISPDPLFSNPVLQNPAIAQTITGQPLTLTSTAPLTASQINKVIYVDQQAGATADVKFANACTALPATGGTLDARGFGAGNQTIAMLVSCGSATQPVSFIWDKATVFQPSAANTNMFQFSAANTWSGLHIDTTNQATYSGNPIQNNPAQGIGANSNSTFTMYNTLVNMASGSTGPCMSITSPSSSVFMIFSNFSEFTCIGGIAASGIVFQNSGGGFINGNRFSGTYVTNTKYGITMTQAGTGAIALNKFFGYEYEANSLATALAALNLTAGGVGGNFVAGNQFYMSAWDLTAGNLGVLVNSTTGVTNNLFVGAISKATDNSTFIANQYFDLFQGVNLNGSAQLAFSIDDIGVRDQIAAKTLVVGCSTANCSTVLAGTTGTGTSLVTNAGPTISGTVRSGSQISDQGSICTNGELALSAGWQSTGSATVTAVAGNGQTCSWTITTGTTTAANPTITDTLTNALPNATTVCEMNIHGGTHTATAGEGFQQTTLSATAPVFTFNGTPTAGGTTYFVTRRCGP